jgi:hypothetical protein
MLLATRGWLFGAILFEVTGGPDAQQLVLEFPLRSAAGEPLDPVQQVICGYWRKAHFGGRYLMFTCPECHRPVRVLYARYAYDRIFFFSCRKCAGITYQSTIGHRWDRSARRVEKLRARLKWGVERHCADQAAGHARKNVPTYFGDAGVPRGRAEAGGKLRPKI